MSDFFPHKIVPSEPRPKTRGEAGFELGAAEAWQAQDLTDGIYEKPISIEWRGSAVRVPPPLLPPPRPTVTLLTRWENRR